MKKYMQPTSEMMALQPEALVATSLPMNEGGTDADPLCNDRTGWGMENWSDAEE